jgi:beta-mannosidase
MWGLGDRITPLREGWRLAVTPPGACHDPEAAARVRDWIEAVAPGTAAQALEAAGRWRREAPTPLHDQDIWYRLPLPQAGRRTLRFDGLATIADVWIDQKPVLSSVSMYQPHEVEAEWQAGAELWICFRALSPVLATKGPRARWRPMMMDNQGLRLVRTTLLGHMPGWCPSIDIVGPWRAVSLMERGPVRVHGLRLQPTWSDGQARLAVELSLAGNAATAVVHCAGASAALQRGEDGRFFAEVAVAQAQPWWPHTHGEQPLYDVRLEADDITLDLGRVGFRSLEADTSDSAGLALRVNGQPVFCRGACWIAPDLVGMGGDRAAYEPVLRQARETGFNMVRISGVGVYETRAFFDTCDELGLLVWQDFMFANFDYPAGDPAFVAQVAAEARALLEGLQGAPSLAVLCGGSEVMQQAAMLGLPTAEMAWPLFDEVLATTAAEHAPGVVYVRNTPSGGALPFVANRGVTHYYGVGAYERPLEDARRADVRFAAECLAFANVPQPESLRRTLGATPAVHDPRWKAGVPRDRGASWDFEDTRDHYLARLYGVDPARLRREDLELYLDMSRVVSGEVMAAVFAEWRRPGSTCAGGLVWTLCDQQPGAGWGLIDNLGEAKPALHALRRVLQPVQVLLTDEGVNGLDIHLINETATPVVGDLQLSAFGAEPGAVVEVRRPVTLAAREATTWSAFDLLGRFFDISYAYRFGPRAHELVVAQLVGEDGGVISRAVHLLPGATGWAGGGDVAATLAGAGDDWSLTLTAERLHRYVHVVDPAFVALEDGFVLAPGEPHVVALRRRRVAPTDVSPNGEILLCGGRAAGRYGD